METHINPDEALSDGPNAWPLGQLKELLEDLIAIHSVTRNAKTY